MIILTLILKYFIVFFFLRIIFIRYILCEITDETEFSFGEETDMSFFEFLESIKKYFFKAFPIKSTLLRLAYYYLIPFFALIILILFHIF